MIHYPKRILIVEDNKADVRLLKDIPRKARIREVAVTACGQARHAAKMLSVAVVACAPVM
jgi:hypothetical protein